MNTDRSAVSASESASAPDPLRTSFTSLYTSSSTSLSMFAASSPATSEPSGSAARRAAAAVALAQPSGSNLADRKQSVDTPSLSDDHDVDDDDDDSRWFHGTVADDLGAPETTMTHKTNGSTQVVTPDMSLISHSSQTTLQLYSSAAYHDAMMSMSSPSHSPTQSFPEATATPIQNNSLPTTASNALQRHLSGPATPQTPRTQQAYASGSSPRSYEPLDSFDAVVQAGDPNHPDHQIWRRRFGTIGTSTRHNDGSAHDSSTSPGNGSGSGRRRELPFVPSSPGAHTADYFFQRENERERERERERVERRERERERVASQRSSSYGGTAAVLASAGSASPAITEAKLAGDRSSWTFPTPTPGTAVGMGASTSSNPPATPRVVASLVAEYEEVAKRIDEEASRSLSRRASMSSLGGRRSSFSQNVHVHGGSGDATWSSSERERDPVYHSVFLDDPRHPESFQAQQLSGALMDPVLLHGALENVGTITAGESARKERRSKRGGEAGIERSGGAGVGSGSGRPLSATSVSAGATRQNSGRTSKRASRRTSANPLRASATSVGHGRPMYGPSPVPPPRVASSSLASGLINSAPQSGFPSGGANPGFVPGTVAELNAAAQAAQSHAGPSSARPTSALSRSTSGVVGSLAAASPTAELAAVPPTSPDSSMQKESSLSRRSGRSRRKGSKRSSRSDVGHATGSTSRLHSLNLPPMPEILPPRGSSMLNLVDTSPNLNSSPPTLPIVQPRSPNRPNAIGRRSLEAKGSPLSFGEIVESPPSPREDPAEHATSAILQRRGVQKSWEPLVISPREKDQALDISQAESATFGPSPRLVAGPGPPATTVDEEQEEIKEEIGTDDNDHRQTHGRWNTSQHGGETLVNSTSNNYYHHQRSLSRVSNDSAQSNWTGHSEPLIIKQRARRGTFGSQRGSGLLPQTAVVPANSSGDMPHATRPPSSAGRPSMSSMRSSAWPYGGEGELLPSAASHGHGSRMMPAQGTPNGAVGSTARGSLSSQSPHSSAALSPEHNLIRLSYGSSPLSSSSRNRDSMFTARSSMSATNGHGLELDGISAQSHEVNSSLGEDYRLGKRGSSVPSVWIGPARAGDETEEGEEFFDARSDEGDEGDDDSGEEQARRLQRRQSEHSQITQQRGRMSAHRDRINKRSSVRSSVLSHPSSFQNGHESPGSSPAKSAGTENHGSDSAAAGHGSVVTLQNGNMPATAKTSDGLLLPPVLVSAPHADPAISAADATECLASSADAPPTPLNTTRRFVASQPKRRSRTNMLAKDAFDEDAETSSNESNDAANSYVRRSSLRPEGRRSKHEHGSRHGDGAAAQLEVGDEDPTVRQGDVPAQVVAVEAEEKTQEQEEDEPLADMSIRDDEERGFTPPTPSLSAFADESLPQFPMKSLREREEIARAKTLRRLEKVEGAAARRRQAEAEARAREASRSISRGASPVERSPDLRDPIQVRFDEERMEKTVTEVRAGVAAPNDFYAERAGSLENDQIYAITSVSDAAIATPDRFSQRSPASPTSPPTPTGRKSLDSKIARRLGQGEFWQRSPESNTGKRGSRAVEFAEVNTVDDFNTASLGRKKGLAALFGRSRRKSVAAADSAPFNALNADAMPMPHPSSIVGARRPSEPVMRITKMSSPVSPEPGPVPSQSVPARISSPVSPAQQHGLGVTYPEESRPATPADGRSTPSGGRWRTRMSSISSMRSPYLGRKSESAVPPVPSLYSPDNGADEEWRRALLVDAVGLSLGLPPSNRVRSESRSGYRSGGDDRPDTPSMYRRPVTPLPMNNADPQETIKKSLSTPLLSDDLVDDGDESNKIDRLMMDLDNGLLIDAVHREGGRNGSEDGKPTVPQVSVIERSVSAARRIRGGGSNSPYLRSPKILQVSDSSGDTQSVGSEMLQPRMPSNFAGPRVYSTIMEDVPHSSRNETAWRNQSSSEATDNLIADGPGSYLSPSEGGHDDSAINHSDLNMSRLRSGSHASLYGNGASDAEGPDDGIDPSLGPAYEPLGRVSKSVDHHQMSRRNGAASSANGEHDWVGTVSVQGHHSRGSGGRAGGAHGRPSGMLSNLKARFRNRRQTDASPLGIGNMRLDNSQGVVHMATGLPGEHARSMPSSAYSTSQSHAASFQGHASQQSFQAAQDATNRLLAVERDLSFTPSLTHSALPPESPSAASLPTSLSMRGSDVPIESFRQVNERRTPHLITPSLTAWSVDSKVAENVASPAGGGPTSPGGNSRRTSTSELMAFDQMLRGYSAANNVLVRQIAARASSSNNHGSPMVSS
ncbi:hypothetical protein CF336_g5212 [Tilletia laevis]|nr:hypothetical protein CF336_g5212 [Tilletia laevis]